MSSHKYPGSFTFISGTVSLATWMVSLHIRPAYGAPPIFAWRIVPFIIVWIQRVRRARGKCSAKEKQGGHEIWNTEVLFSQVLGMIFDPSG